VKTIHPHLYPPPSKGEEFKEDCLTLRGRR